MQINYVRYLTFVGNDWGGAVQNPAYRASGIKNRAIGAFFIKSSKFRVQSSNIIK